MARRRESQAGLRGVERLVAVPAVSHVTRFSYAPYPVYLGLVISAVAAVAWRDFSIVMPDSRGLRMLCVST